MISNMFENKQFAQKIISLLQNDFKLYVREFNGKGLLVANTTFEGQEVEFPLLITQPVIGEYTGDFKIVSNVKAPEANAPISLNHNDITKSSLRENIMATAYPYQFVMYCDRETFDNFSDEQKAWIQQHIGKTYIMVSSDPFMSESDFERMLQYENGDWTIRNSKTIKLIGVN